MIMNWSKEKPKINLVIDAIMLFLLMALAGLGFLIKYVLLPGYKRNALYEGDVELYFMGFTRHEWGSIHLWLGYLFLLLLVLHIILHWRMITCIFQQMIKAKVSRYILAIFTAMVSLFLCLAPFFVKPEIVPNQVKHIHRQDIKPFMTIPQMSDVKSASDLEKTKPAIERLHKNQQETHHEGSHSELEIYGYMTLEEAAQQFSIPVKEIAASLNIPQEQCGEKIGRLRKRYGFEMEELKAHIMKLKDNQHD